VATAGHGDRTQEQQGERQDVRRDSNKPVVSHRVVAGYSGFVVVVWVLRQPDDADRSKSFVGSAGSIFRTHWPRFADVLGTALVIRSRIRKTWPAAHGFDVVSLSVRRSWGRGVHPHGFTVNVLQTQRAYERGHRIKLPNRQHVLSDTIRPADYVDL
jgi:hypothetical protein